MDQLSTGIQEQIAVLIRLAFAELLTEQNIPATVVLDDALVYSDDQRMQSMFDILNAVSNNVQIIIFTCRENLFQQLEEKTLKLKGLNENELPSA